MARMATTPVFACRRCGRPVAISLSTVNDPKAETLRSIMQHLHEIALCPRCQKVKLYLQSQGRESEFVVRPDGVIYNVLDESGLDYYGRKMK